jgi:hypothetical protein
MVAASLPSVDIDVDGYSEAEREGAFAPISTSAVRMVADKISRCAIFIESCVLQDVSRSAALHSRH